MAGLLRFSLGIILLILLLTALPVHAATITVDSSCTLEYAIYSANFDADQAGGACTDGSGDDVIVVSGTVTLSASLPPISSNITIQGGGIIDGGSAVRVLRIENGNVTLSNITIRNGSAGPKGGGIRVVWDPAQNYRPSLTVTNSTVSGNAATGSNAQGGGIYFDSPGALTITNSSILNNSAVGTGGGLYITTNGSPGSVAAKTITNTVISGNSAPEGAAISGGGGGANSTFTVDRSAIHSNTLSGEKGIISVRNMVLKNSTLYGNSGSHAKSTAIFAWLKSGDTVTLNHVTIAGNTLARGLHAFKQAGAINVYNSIIAGTSSSDCFLSIATALSAKAGNLFEDGTCSAANSGDPKLATRVSSENYFRLYTGSPAIDAADSTQCTAAGNDQRNVARSAPCDIGAIQADAVTPPTPAPTAAFTVSKTFLTVNFDSSTSTGSGLTYAWEFGDGNTSTSASPTHTYASGGTYNVKLTVTNSGGTANVTQSVTVDVAVTAAFTVSKTYLAVAFDSSTSTGSSLTYAWEFGDGNTSTSASPTHTYASAGTYNVKLTVTNAGGTANVTQSVTVVAEVTAAFTYSTEGLTATFDSSTSTGASLAYAWEFGDGNTSTSASPTHTYATAGDYTVKLTVTSAGTSVDTTQSVTVSIDADAAFNYSATGLMVTFDSSPSAGSNVNYSWDFGDGSAQSTEANPTHTYAAAGDYSVSLTVANSSSSDTHTESITVEEIVIPEAPETQEQRSGSGSGSADAEQSDSGNQGFALPPGMLINSDLADGMSVWAQHGLLSGIQFQRRELDSIHIIQAPNIDAVIMAGIQDVIEVWGFTAQSWEVCVENSRLGASGGLMFIEKKSDLSIIAHTAPGAVNEDGETCLKLHDKKGYVALVAYAPAPASLPPTATPYRETLSLCMVRTNFILNLRAEPDGAVLRHIPFDVQLTAFQRTEAWFYVDYHGERGWLSAQYLTPIGACE